MRGLYIPPRGPGNISPTIILSLNLEAEVIYFHFQKYMNGPFGFIAFFII